MTSSKIYLDSNVWINYLWVDKVSFTKKFDNKNRAREICSKLVKSLSKSQNKVISSLFNDSEISSYFRDYMRFLRGLGLGFDFTNAHKHKDSFSLTKKERKEINNYLVHIAGMNFVEVVDLDLDPKSLHFFRLATCDFDIDYMDTFHLLGAMINGCRYLITADKDFCLKANKLLKNQKLNNDIKILYYKEAGKVLKI